MLRIFKIKRPALNMPLPSLRPFVLVAPHFFHFHLQFSPFPGIKKGTDFSIPFFQLCCFLYKFNFSFHSKATTSERSVTDNNPIRCVTTHLWDKAVALDGLGHSPHRMIKFSYLKHYWFTKFLISINFVSISVISF